MTVRVKGVVNKEERAPHGRDFPFVKLEVLSSPAEPLPLAIDKMEAEYFSGSQIKLPFPFPPQYSGARKI